jgi:uncharacterized membrane-anchored protein YhcB (DUF1043 family)
MITSFIIGFIVGFISGFLVFRNNAAKAEKYTKNIENVADSFKK